MRPIFPVGIVPGPPPAPPDSINRQNSAFPPLIPSSPAIFHPNQAVTQNLSTQIEVPSVIRNTLVGDKFYHYAASLGVSSTNGNTTKKKIQLKHRQYKIVKGKPVVSFIKEEHDLLAETYRLSIVGIFPRTRPSIEKIRTKFLRTIPLKGVVKIGAYNLKNMFIDFDLEEDHKSVYGRSPLIIGGMKMKLQNRLQILNLELKLLWLQYGLIFLI